MVDDARLPAVSADVPVLSAEQLEALPPELREAYVAALVQELEESPLTPPQMRAHDLCNRVDELLYGGAAGSGKAVTLRTPIPTPGGWRTMGEIRAGDYVFAPDGKPVLVQAATEVMYGHRCYRMTFDDGTEIVADADHQWVTMTEAERNAAHRRTPEFKARRRANRPSRSTGRRPDVAARNQATAIAAVEQNLPVPTGSVRTTEQIAQSVLTVRGRKNHTIPVCDPVQIDDAALPIDPYVLGAWLGDGSTSSGIMACHVDEQEWMRVQFEDAGITTTTMSATHAFGTKGFTTQLRSLGVLGNKHVPDEYLWASETQRRDLLAGLMDTDGYTDERGSIEFCSTRKVLADAVLFLLRSLGVRATMNEGRSTLNGKDMGPKWRVIGSPSTQVFRMPRKAETLANAIATTRRSSVTERRYIVAVEEVPSEPVKCIQVEGGLYLCSAAFIPTHNSHLAVWHADRLSRQFPGHRTLMLRTSFPELRRTLMAKAHEMIDANADPGVVWKAADKEWHYGNGSVIEFGFCASMEDVRQYLSAEYELIVIDESTEMTGEMIEMIRSRLRTTKVMREIGVNPHLLLLTNPGGIGHVYHRDRYVTTTNNGEYVAEIDERDSRGRGRKRNVAFVPARVWDNPHIDPDYESNLVAIKDPVKRAQYLDGDWSVNEGAFFAEFRTDVHVVEPFQIKPEWGWPIIGGYDWGYASPACLLLGAVDQDRRIHIFREMYETGWTAARQAQEFRSWNIKVDYIAADPSIWRDTGVGKPISRQLVESGMLPLRKAHNERLAGWNAVREALYFDEETIPKLVIHSNCENLIRTLPDLPRDKKKPEDLDTRTEDHAADALRYLVQSRSRGAPNLMRRNKSYDERVSEYVTGKVSGRKRVHDVLGAI